MNISDLFDTTETEACGINIYLKNNTLCAVSLVPHEGTSENDK